MMRKIFSIVLAVLLVLGASGVTFAAVDTSQLGWCDNSALEDKQTVRPDKSYKLYLSYKGLTATREDIRSGKVGVQIRATEGGKALIKSCKIKYDGGSSNGDAYVELKFIDEWVSTGTKDFNIELYLTADKQRIDGTKAELFGGFSHPSFNIGENSTYVYLGDTPVVKAEDYIRNIQVDLGQGVSVYSKMFEGKKYYGRVTQEPTTADEEIMAKYPAIDSVYTLKTIRLTSAGENVKFDLEDNLYAYGQNKDGNLFYIGRTNDRLTFSKKYFLATKELEIEDVEQAKGELELEILEPGVDLEHPPIVGGDGR